MRFWAFSAFQPAVAVCCWVTWPETTFRVPSSIFGCRMLMAPSKNGLELASSGEPEISSMFHGDFLADLPRPSRRAVPCSTPTLKLS